ncbi:SNF7 family protein [Actinidia rufa]|uniref:SNF7 family protein n=1 Tax=Actinidia rufa TaxID=165716 RepID=A0A7J0DVY0_9ERIC|nr:SNF7 family protein [Actinidia rufa]
MCASLYRAWDEEEEETEELVSQVLDEIGIDMNSELLNAPSSAVAAPAANNKVAQAEATGIDDGGIDSDLQARDKIALMEGGKGLEMKETGNEVVVSIFGIEENSRTDKQIGGSKGFKKLESGPPYFSNNIPIGSPSISKNTPIGSPISGPRETESLKTSSSSLEITNSSPTPNKPPEISVGSVIQRSSPSPPTSKTNASTPKENVNTAPVTPKTPLMASQGGEDEDEDDENVYKTSNLKLDEKSGKRLKAMVILEWIVFVLITETVGRQRSSGEMSFKSQRKGKQAEKEEVIDVEKLHKMKQEKISAWTMRGLIQVIQRSGLSTISSALDESFDDDEQKEKEITSEWEAKAAAYQIFKNVARPGCKYIQEEDLLRFMKKEDVDNVLPLFEGLAETGKIKRSSLRKWVVNVYNERDRCVIDGVQMIVEEVNILTTIFLRYDNEKIFYPNSVLATKAISNYYRSPEMGDSVEFSVDFSTSTETIVALKAKIKAYIILKKQLVGNYRYIESKPQHWRPNHSLQLRDIEDVNKMKLGLYVTHTINFQNFGEKANRRSDLVFELKKIFGELGIKYNLLPQEVHLSNVGSAADASR